MPESLVKNKKVLVVDDEELIVKIMTTKISRAGFEVYSAMGGYEALEVIEKVPIDFVISDISMPNGDGIELLKLIRAKDREYPPVILLTAFSKYTQEEVASFGAQHLLRKPVDILKIVELLGKYISR